MLRKKPQGWPKLMVPKRLRSGAVAYYWDIPSWARKAGCTLHAEALGTDYSTAKSRCDSLLNPQFDAWRLRDADFSVSKSVPGSFDWMTSVYKASPKYSGKTAKYRKDVDALLSLVSSFRLKDGRTFGLLQLQSITPGAADKLHERLKAKADGTERARTAKGAMVACRRAWNIAHRVKPAAVPLPNPFAKMDISYTPATTRPVSYGELMRFVAAADKDGSPSIGTAAMIAFFWLQRQIDILSRLTWGHYRPTEAPNCARIFHHKTKVLYDLPLYDDDGTALWPELMARLDNAPRRGTLIVTRDVADRRRKTFLPWAEDYFRHCVADIRTKAGIPSEVKFMGLRHGGNVEGADAGHSDAQLRSLSGHKTTAALLRYAQKTPAQQRAGARKRLEARTKKGILSE
jgi:hypothetical protein